MTLDGPAPLQAPARVEISAAGRQVVVEAPEPLKTVADTALSVWHTTDDPQMRRGFGLTDTYLDRPSGPLPEELTLPARLTLVETDDGQPRARR